MQNLQPVMLKYITRAYAENEDQLPNDLALLDVKKLIEPAEDRLSRIWNGLNGYIQEDLLDVPDSLGETRGQGQASRNSS